MKNILLPDTEERALFWQKLIEEIETYLSVVDKWRVPPGSTVKEIETLLNKFDFEKSEGLLNSI